MLEKRVEDLKLTPKLVVLRIRDSPLEGLVEAAGRLKDTDEGWLRSLRHVVIIHSARLGPGPSSTPEKIAAAVDSFMEDCEKLLGVMLRVVIE